MGEDVGVQPAERVVCAGGAPAAVRAAGIGHDVGGDQGQHGGEVDGVGVDAGERRGLGRGGGDHVVYGEECPYLLAGRSTERPRSTRLVPRRVFFRYR